MNLAIGTNKDFAEATNKPSLIEYISHQLYSCKVTNTQLTDLLNQDKALVLLDGLDEVREDGKPTIFPITFVSLHKS